jgi:hypothetical protein
MIIPNTLKQELTAERNALEAKHGCVCDKDELQAVGYKIQLHIHGIAVVKDFNGCLGTFSYSYIPLFYF